MDIRIKRKYKYRKFYTIVMQVHTTVGSGTSGRISGSEDLHVSKDKRRVWLFGINS